MIPWQARVAIYRALLLMVFRISVWIKRDECMRVLMINSVCGIKSTGRICAEMAEKLERDGHQVKIAYGRDTVPAEYQKYAVRIGTDLDPVLSAVHTRLTDKHGFGNKRATREFLRWADRYDPELLLLHNIHGYYINVEMLFEWIKKRPALRVEWTLHDCWAFTGHCSYFSKLGCTKWKAQCMNCEQRKLYPSSVWMDNCQENYIRKKRAFTGVKHMTLVTPSQWLAGLVQQSFLKEYPVEVRNNTIDTGVFIPTPSDFREQYGLQQKSVVLGVASVWGSRKGLPDFIKLSHMLGDQYRIILVGVNSKQMKQLPEKIIGIQHTNSKQQLAEIYTAADVFLNLTYEDNYPTVNLEARACGTPIITYNTGGSPESAGEDAFVVEQGDLCRVAEIITHLCGRQP